MKNLYWKKFLSALIFGGAGLFTLVFFSPLEVYLGNPSEFHVYADNAVLILLATAAVCTLIWSAAVSFLPTKVLKFVNLGVFAITLCFYVQALALNGKLISLDGEELILTRATKLGNGLIWVAILAVVPAIWYLMKRLKKEKLYINITKYLALALVAMQLTGMVSLYVNCDKATNVSKSLYFSNEEKLTLAEENNVVYFIIDYCDGYLASTVFSEDPSRFAEFTGFTYYPNATFAYSRTYPALTYLLSGNRCYFDKPYTQYVDESFQEDSFLAEVDALGADVRIYTDSRYVGANAVPYVDNYKTDDSTKLSAVNVWGFLAQSWKVSAFRGAPYAAKPLFEYTTDEVNDASAVRQSDYAYVRDDLVFYDEIKTDKINVNKRYDAAFRFYHMVGSHPGTTVNENAEREEGVSLDQALRGNVKIISEYLRQMKELGVYDSSTIIVTADHGYVGETFSGTQTCIMMVKMAGDDSSKPIQITDAPVCHEDLFPTVIKGLGGDHSKYGETIDHISSTAQRQRYHYNSELKGGREVLLKEYLIDGDARDVESYHFTGNQWIAEHTI